jgi:hypothetical protein
MLEAVTRERLKTQQAGKYLECAVVICKVWRLAMVLHLSVVPSCVYKWSINPISDKITAAISTLLLVIILSSSLKNRVAGCCVEGNEFAGVYCQLIYYYRLKKDSASRTGRFTPEKQHPVPIGEAALDAVTKRYISYLGREPNLSRSSR